MAVYVRPLGLMPAMRSDRSIPAQPATGDAPFTTGALPLADGPLDFTAVEVTSLTANAIRRVTMPLDTLWQSSFGDTETATAIAAALERLTRPRRRIAGLAFDRPLIMGVINVTPDSFSDGGRFHDAEAAIAHGCALAAAGADLLDIGGESTRPGATETPIADELARIVPVIAGLHAATDLPLSIDTRKARVMQEAIAAGASIINDVSALRHDPESITVAAELGVPVVLMHALGDPRTMQLDPRYRDVTTEVFDFLAARIAACEDAGIPRDRLILDPGIGFGKTLAHNLQLIAELAMLHGLGCPLLLGVSRKSFIGKVSGEPVADQRLPGSLAAALAGVAQGAQILRVHDVAETRAAFAVWQAVRSGMPPFEASPRDAG